MTRHDRLLTTAIAVAASAVIIAGVATLIVQPGSDSGSARRPTPASTSGQSGVSGAVAAEAAATAYYAAVHHDDARAAYGLLCLRAQTGYPAYSAEVSTNNSTGTGVRSYRGLGQGRVRAGEAAVPATIVLDDGIETPIVVLLVRESGEWRVCSSNLGGVLPPPGPLSSRRPAPVSSPSAAGVSA